MKVVNVNVQVVQNFTYIIFFYSLFLTLSFSLPSFQLFSFSQLFKYTAAQFPKQTLPILVKAEVSLPGYSCVFFMVYVTKHCWFILFFFCSHASTFALCCSLHSERCADQHQDRKNCAGKRFKKAAQISLKCFGKSVAGTHTSPPAICINCFNSFPSYSVSCSFKEWVLIFSYYFKGQPAQTSSIPMT